jgi:SAM-dependent methyltransferase
LSFASGTFDAVLCLDVLEHLQDDTKGAAEIARVLAPDGIAIVAVPAFQLLWGVTDEISHHYRRYTRPRARRLLQDAGLRVVRATYFNAILSPVIAVVRLAVRFLRLPLKSESKLENKLINALLYGIFRFESLVLPFVSFPFGVSVLLIARHPASRFEAGAPPSSL